MAGLVPPSAINHFAAGTSGGGSLGKTHWAFSSPPCAYPGEMGLKWTLERIWKEGHESCPSVHPRGASIVCWACLIPKSWWWLLTGRPYDDAVTSLGGLSGKLMLLLSRVGATGLGSNTSHPLLASVLKKEKGRIWSPYLAPCEQEGQDSKNQFCRPIAMPQG